MELRVVVVGVVVKAFVAELVAAVYPLPVPAVGALGVVIDVISVLEQTARGRVAVCLYRTIVFPVVFFLRFA